MADKSGMSRMLDLIKDQAKSVVPDGIMLSAVKAGGKLTYSGIDLDASDYYILNGIKLATDDIAAVYKIEGDPADAEDDQYLVVGRVDNTGSLDIVAIWTAIHDLQDTKVDKISGKGLSENDYTTAEKAKLAGIETGAQVNPRNVSELTNDAGYQTASQVASATAGKVDKVSGKGLSTEDYSTAEKTKLSGIADGADMTKDVYDTTNNGNCDMADDVVLDAETVALWNSILGS